MKYFTQKTTNKVLLTLGALLIAFTSFAQTNLNGGDSCSTAVTIASGTYFSDGFLTDGEFEGLCLSATNADNGDWYTFTATVDGYANVNSDAAYNYIDSGSTSPIVIDTEVSIFSGSCDNLVCVGFDDDGGPGFLTDFSWPICVGETYFIQWDDRWNDTSYVFNISFQSATLACDSTPGDATFDLTFDGFSDATWSVGNSFVNGGTTFDYEILPLGGVIGVTTPLASGTGAYPASISVAGLNSSTSYELWVRNNCNGCASLSSPWNSTIFTTAASSVSGVYFVDEDGDCVWDSTETTLSDRLVVLTDAMGNVDVTVTDINGSYTFAIPLGTYTIAPVAPNASWDILCSDTVIINDTIPVTDFNLGIASSQACPHMDVTISTNFLRCLGFFDNNNTYVVQYANNGATTATNASIEITIEDHVSYVSSSIPVLSQVGNTYTFDLGDVAPFETGSFTYVVVLDCDSIAVGQNICIEAEVFPQINCIPSNNVWDGSNLELAGVCENDDTVHFALRNVGADMTGPSSIIAIEDDILTVQNTVTLNAQEVTFFSFVANGSTYYMEAQQRPGHPQPIYVSDFVEACGTNAFGTFSTGFSSIIPPPIPASPYLAVWCEEVVASYDPNDKTVWPQGYGVEHLIEENVDLDYRIRFQNSGTDTAFNIYVLDTLSEHYDLTTFKMTSASHAYTYQFYGKVLRVEFPAIFLVDSNTNEALSHGYFTYEIAQKPNLPIGTVISNDAFIYFDLNEPIATNVVFNTIGEDFIEVNLTSGIDDLTEIPINVYPNPFREFTTFDLGISYDNVELQITDVQGKVVFNDKYSEASSLKLTRDQFNTPGSYFFSIRSEEMVIGSGTVMVQ